MLSHLAAMNPHLIRRIYSASSISGKAAYELLINSSGVSVGTVKTDYDYPPYYVNRKTATTAISYSGFIFPMPLSKDVTLKKVTLKGLPTVNTTSYFSARIYVEDTLDPASFVAGNTYSVSNKTLLPAYIDWTFANSIYTPGDGQLESPDIKSLVQPILDKPGWDVDKEICFILQPFVNNAESYTIGLRYSPPPKFICDYIDYSL